MMPYPNLFSVVLVQLEETDSTNHQLKLYCDQSNVSELTTVVTNYQTAGRGQRGNTWESESGKNLLFSFVLYPNFIKARQQFVLAQIISLALKEELDQYAEGFTIKWPNDIYWNDRKIAGILIENDLTGSLINRSIVGVGLNVNQPVFHSDAPNPVSLWQITGEEQDLMAILDNVMKRVKGYYTPLLAETTQTVAWRTNAMNAIATRYQEALYRKEGMHSYTDDNGEFSAKIQDVSPEGYLILLDATGLQRSYAFKEVQYCINFVTDEMK